MLDPQGDTLYPAPRSTHPTELERLIMMKLALAACCCLSLSALAADKMAAPAAPAKTAEVKAPMTFTPRKVTTEDKKGIEAMYAAHEAACMKGEWETAAASVDFPIYMVTDNAKGEVWAANWDRKQWIDDMTASMNAMPKDAKMKHDRKYTFLTNEMAMVSDTVTGTMGSKKETWKSAGLVVKKDGKWMMKSMIEGGWGDMPSAKPREAKMMNDTPDAVGAR